jgi:hypothetical protein
MESSTPLWTWSLLCMISIVCTRVDERIGGEPGGTRAGTRRGLIPGVTGSGVMSRVARGITPVAGKIRGYARHGLNQAISREGVGVSPGAILDAVRNPQRVIERHGGVTEYVGKMARVRLNEAGRVVTVIPRGRQGFRLPVGQ